MGGKGSVEEEVGGAFSAEECGRQRSSEQEGWFSLQPVLMGQTSIRGVGGGVLGTPGHSHIHPQKLSGHFSRSAGRPASLAAPHAAATKTASRGPSEALPPGQGPAQGPPPPASQSLSITHTHTHLFPVLQTFRVCPAFVWTSHWDPFLSPSDLSPSPTQWLGPWPQRSGGPWGPGLMQ